MTDRLDVNRRMVLAGAAAVAATSAARAADTPAAPDLSGKSVLITGASSGFGRLSALHFARSGANVIASMRNLKKGRRPEAAELLDIASAEKLTLNIVEIDVTRDAEVRSGVAQAETIAGGALDVLLNNAGIGGAGPVELYDHAEAMRHFDVNLFGYQRMARAVLPRMRAKGQGLLAQVSSQLGRVVLPNVGVYCSTKFAVEAMFEAMAYELAPIGVDVTIIQPGGYPTRIWENGARYLDDLLASADAERKAAYDGHLKLAQGFFGGGGSTDPMDVPRAIADVIALPPGKRPLRRPVHPNTGATDALNAAHAQVQASVMGRGAYKTWHDAVVD
ncbi:MAG TPA: short-chain dehydrogenase/reductase [Parvularcula sp.]|nr:short-chain dehydrogenase/reductase [Parvularcula sp.]